MAEQTNSKLTKPTFLRIILCAAAGIALILIGNAVLGGREDSGKTGTAPSAPEELRAYTESVKAEITALCSSVAGVGKVTVSVTLSGGYVYEYATDYQMSSGGAESEKHVTVGSGSGESPVYLSVRPPGIAGIGIVCEGGGDAGVRRELIALLSAAYGIGSNKIYVTASE